MIQRVSKRSGEFKDQSSVRPYRPRYTHIIPNRSTRPLPFLG